MRGVYGGKGGPEPSLARGIRPGAKGVVCILSLKL